MFVNPLIENALLSSLSWQAKRALSPSLHSFQFYCSSAEGFG